MKEWKVLKNISDKSESVTSGGNIYNFSHGEMKIVPSDDAKFIVEKYLHGPLGEPKFVFVNGKDIPQEFVNKMLASNSNTKILINKYMEKIELMYGGIKYIFKNNCKVVLDAGLSDILQSRSWSAKEKKYLLEFVEAEKKEEKKEVIEEPSIEKEQEEIVVEEKHRGRPKKK